LKRICDKILANSHVFFIIVRIFGSDTGDSFITDEQKVYQG